MKRCFKCGEEKPLSDFYAHKQMLDGHLGKCKECTKRDTARRYVEKRDKVREYERLRFNTPHRKAKVIEYQRKRRAVHREKNIARSRLTYAVRAGNVTPMPCEVCGCKEVEAHHTDYSRPLDVQWLCFKCHREHGHGQKVG